eukprot:1145251-Pelagomonas_calceolata.AAC.5
MARPASSSFVKVTKPKPFERLVYGSHITRASLQARQREGGCTCLVAELLGCCCGSCILPCSSGLPSGISSEKTQYSHAAGVPGKGVVKLEVVHICAEIAHKNLVL